MENLLEKLQEQYDSSDIRYAEILEILKLLHSNLIRVLSQNNDPRGRMALAELLQSYANLQRTILDIGKHKTDIVAKAIDLTRKLKEIDVLNSTNLDIFKIQKVLLGAGLLSSTNFTEQNIQE